MQYQELKSFFEGKTVLVTGHSGFGGKWLTSFLFELGANVIGFSDNKIGEASALQLRVLKEGITEIKADIRDSASIAASVKKYKPEYIFHLAAQSEVFISTQEPLRTFSTNVNGLVNLMDAAKKTKSVAGIVVVSTDKVYRPNKFEEGFKEQDPLGGCDPYSSSKIMAEFAAECYACTWGGHQKSHKGFSVAVVRPGNWIGGGDFAKHRLVPNLASSLSGGTPIVLRHPDYIRPWHYILDSVVGLLTICISSQVKKAPFFGHWNLGPKTDEIFTVKEIASMFAKGWDGSSQEIRSGKQIAHETASLILNSEKARSVLNWSTHYSVEEALLETAGWYKSVTEGHGSSDGYRLYKDLIEIYMKKIA